MARRSRPALRAILESIDGIQRAIEGRSLDEFSANWLLNHAVQRGIEIISEASRRLPQSLRDQHPEIPWPAVIGIGNILRHDYDEIIDEVIFRAATTQLAALKAAVSAIDAALDEPDE